MARHDLLFTRKGLVSHFCILFLPPWFGNTPRPDLLPGGQAAFA